MRFRVTFEGVIAEDDGDLMAPDALDALLDQVGDELAKLSDAKDADVGATLAHGLVEIAVSVETLSPHIDSATNEAMVNGGAMIRCALHAAKVATPGWSMAHPRITIESDSDPDLGIAGREAKEAVDA